MFALVTAVPVSMLHPQGVFAFQHWQAWPAESLVVHLLYNVWHQRPGCVGSELCIACLVHIPSPAIQINGVC